MRLSRGIPETAATPVRVSVRLGIPMQCIGNPRNFYPVPTGRTIPNQGKGGRAVLATAWLA
eukprot:2469581-Rhodomonas_salina.1